MTNHNTTWTQEENNLLQTYRRSGFDYHTIGTVMNRSDRACQQQMYRLRKASEPQLAESDPILEEIADLQDRIASMQDRLDELQETKRLMEEPVFEVGDVFNIGMEKELLCSIIKSRDGYVFGGFAGNLSNLFSDEPRSYQQMAEFLRDFAKVGSLVFTED